MAEVLEFIRVENSLELHQFGAQFLVLTGVEVAD